MAFYEGETLRKKMESGLLGLQEVVAIGDQIGQGLRRAHELGVTHRTSNRRTSSSLEKVFAGTPIVGPAASLSIGQRLPQPGVAITALLALLVLGLTLAGFLHRRFKVTWAREQLPEISRLIESEDYSAAVALARQIEPYIPSDPRLAKLWPRMSEERSFETTPPGAEVHVRSYRCGAEVWEHPGR